MAHGSWLTTHGSWLTTHCSWLLTHCSLLIAQNSAKIQPHSKPHDPKASIQNAMTSPKRITAAIWQSYPALHPRHTVSGDLRVCQQVYSPQLDNARDVLVWLPPSYPATATSTPPKRYPVLYMQDGQNLFDAHTSFAGEWHMDEIMLQLGAQQAASDDPTSDTKEAQYEAIIVGLPNTGERFSEYNPFALRSAHWPASRGADYVRWLIETVKPMIDADFRTLPDADHTGIGGSSMGGLISLYAHIVHNDVFGMGLSMSPSAWLGGRTLMQMIADEARGRGRLYLDVGAHEGRTDNRSHNNYYVRMGRQMRDALLQSGYIEGQTLCYVEDEDGEHNEASWSRRLPGALRFVLGGA